MTRILCLLFQNGKHQLKSIFEFDKFETMGCSFEPVKGKTRESKSRDTNGYNLGGKFDKLNIYLINIHKYIA